MITTTLPAIVDDYSTTTQLELEVKELLLSVLNFEQYEQCILSSFSDLIEDTSKVYAAVLSMLGKLQEKKPDYITFDDERDECTSGKRDECTSGKRDNNLDKSCAKVFRQIAAKCHPDKTKTVRLHSIYKQALDARKDRNLELLEKLFLSINKPTIKLYAVKQEYLEKQRTRLLGIETKQRSSRFYPHFLADGSTISVASIKYIGNTLIQENNNLHSEYAKLTRILNTVKRAEKRSKDDYNWEGFVHDFT